MLCFLYLSVKWATSLRLSWSCCISSITKHLKQVSRSIAHMSLELLGASVIMLKHYTWNTHSLKTLFLVAFKWEYCILPEEMDVERETYRAEIILFFPRDALIPDSKSLYYMSVKKVGTVWKPIIDSTLRRKGNTHGKISSRATDVAWVALFQGQPLKAFVLQKVAGTKG